MDTDTSAPFDHVGRLLAGSAVVAAFWWWLAGLTAGDLDGGRYDVDWLSYIAWFAFLLFAILAGGLAIVGVLRPVERLVARRRDGATEARAGHS